MSIKKLIKTNPKNVEKYYNGVNYHMIDSYTNGTPCLNCHRTYGTGYSIKGVRCPVDIQFFVDHSNNTPTKSNRYKQPLPRNGRINKKQLEMIRIIPEFWYFIIISDDNRQDFCVMKDLAIQKRMTLDALNVLN